MRNLDWVLSSGDRKSMDRFKKGRLFFVKNSYWVIRNGANFWACFIVGSVKKILKVKDFLLGNGYVAVSQLFFSVPHKS